jgi:hypothetical protein
LLLVLLVGARTLAADLETDKNRFTVRAHAIFGVEAKFKNLGGFSRQADSGPATNRVDHFYDDGYNRVDASANTNGLTWYWGYQNASQLAGADSIAMHSAVGTASGSLDAEADLPQWGLELVYSRELGSSSSYWWAVELGFGWLDLSFSENATLPGDITLTTDTYGLNGIVPPLAPYAGSFNGPGPLIGDQPSRSVATLPGAAVTAGRYRLDASVYTVRLGILYESPFNDWLGLQFGGGGLAAFVDGEFSFSEQVSYGSTTVNRSGAESESDFVGGAYAMGGLAFHLTERVVATLGAQYNFLGDFSQEFNEKEASIDFKHSLLVSAGVGIKF